MTELLALNVQEPKYSEDGIVTFTWKCTKN